MAAREIDPVEKKLDQVIQLLQHILALQLASKGVNKGDIGKHLHVAKSTVVSLLRGVKAANT